MGRPERSRAVSSLVVLGLAAAVSQAVLLREGMAALGGSELSWGVVLATWLAGMALGARLGATYGIARHAALAPVAAVILAVAGVVLLLAVPALTGAVSGEAPGTLRGMWAWVLAVFPTAVAGGWAFPVLAGALEGRAVAGRAYALEAAGGLGGGLAFSFVLASRGSLVALGVALALGVMALAPARRRVLATGVALGIVALAVPVSGALARVGWHWAGRPGDLRAWSDTRQQRVELSAGSPASVYGDGELLATFPDRLRAVPEGHLLALLHPRPRRVLCVGCLVSGVVPTLLRHPLERLDLAEDDPQLAALLPLWFGGELAAALADPRVTLLSSEPLRAVGRAGPWDEILLLDGDPTTLRRNRTRTVGFVRACAQRLAPGGVLVMRVGVADTYLGGAGGRLLAVLSATLRTSFADLKAIPGEEVLLVASAPSAGISLDPAVLARRWQERGIHDDVFGPAVLRLLLDPGRAEALEGALSVRGAEPNLAARPRAVLLAAALSEGRMGRALVSAARIIERTSPRWFAAAVALVAVALVAGGRMAGPPVMGAAAVAGFASMGWWLLLLASWQATLGSVYAEVGALSGAFMAGLAVGALVTRNKDGRRWLPSVLAAGAGLSVVIALGLPLALPRLAVVPLLVLGGILTGAAFPGIAALAGKGRVRRGAGRGFAADEIGAGMGALVVGVVALPWVGMSGVAWALAVLSLAAAAAVRRGDRTMTGAARREPEGEGNGYG